MTIRPQTALVVLNALLVAGIGAAWVSGSSHWEEPAPVTPDPSSITSHSAGAQVVEVAGETLAARPLFAQSRRPLAPEATEGAAAAASPSALQDVRLLGILGKGSDGVVIVRVGGGSKRLKLGDELEGWTLDAANGRTARFARGQGEVRELYLEHAAQQAAPVSKPVAAAQPNAAASGQDAAPARNDAAPPPATNAAAGRKSAEELIAERRARREAVLSRARVN